LLLSLSSATAPDLPVISSLSLHDALPISAISNRGGLFCSARSSSPRCCSRSAWRFSFAGGFSFELASRDSPFEKPPANENRQAEDRKSTRLNSSHVAISYAVFCLKKKKKI